MVHAHDTNCVHSYCSDQMEGVVKGVCSHSTYLVVCSPPEQDLGLNRSQSPCLQTHTHTYSGASL